MSKYRDAGVDIDGASLAVRKIRELAQMTYSSQVISGIGGFSGLFDLGALNFRNPVLAAGADGVGTKVKIAQELGKHDTVGIDLVAMNVDDVVTCGAKPLFFLDYIAVGKLQDDVIADLVKGIALGCRQAGCVLLGGETAQMPGIYGEDEYDLAGFCVGIVEKDRIIDGRTIVPGDVLVGLASSGLHSNGFTLARKVLLDEARLRLDQYIPELGRTLGEELLEPTKIYAPAVLQVAASYRVKGVAHITGGGIVDNVPRVLPPGRKFKIDFGWDVPPIFSMIQKLGHISRDEMFRVFNMGVGMVLVLSQEEVDGAVSLLKDLGCKAFPIGEICSEVDNGV